MHDFGDLIGKGKVTSSTLPLLDIKKQGRKRVQCSRAVISERNETMQIMQLLQCAAPVHQKRAATLKPVPLR